MIREFTGYHRYHRYHNSDKEIGNWWVKGFVELMTMAAADFTQKIKQAMSTNPDAFEFQDTFGVEIGERLIGYVYYRSKLRKEFEEKDFTLADDVNLSVPAGGSMCLWQAYLAATGQEDNHF